MKWYHCTYIILREYLIEISPTVVDNLFKGRGRGEIRVPRDDSRELAVHAGQAGFVPGSREAGSDDSFQHRVAWWYTLLGRGQN